MAVNRKGFIYTLESVIAASLMLGTIIFVVPEVRQGAPPAFEDINSAIASLDETGELEGNRTDIAQTLSPYSPSNFNLTVRTTVIRTEEGSVSGEEQFYLSSGTKELLMWVEPDSSPEVTYRGNTVFDRGQSGYHRVNLNGESGYLNFTGSSDLDFEVQFYARYGELPITTEAYSTNYIDYNGTLREIQVITWQ